MSSTYIGVTPVERELEVGIYNLLIQLAGYEDYVTTAEIVADETTAIEAVLIKKEEEMTVIFSGSVSAQATSGEAVTITVTLPAGGTEQVITSTLADKTFSVEYSNTPGNYSAKARIEEDALYQAAESAEVAFSIGKEPRTITLEVR